MCAHAETSATRWLPVVLLSLLVAATCAKSAGGQALNLQWRTIDAGGRASSSGVTAVNGTVAQPDAGAPLAAGVYTLVGGFWRGAREVRNRLIFADGFASGNTSAWSAVTPMVEASGPAEPSPVAAPASTPAAPGRSIVVEAEEPAREASADG